MIFDSLQLQSFVILAKERHFGRAARKLFVTQPALSRRIQQLELNSGVELFRRDRKRVDLTAAGAAFLPHVEAIVEAMEAAHRTALNAAGALAGRVTIGFDGAGSYTLIPRLIEHATRLMPQLDIEFIELSSVDQMREVEFHRLDIGLVRPLPHDAAILTEAVFSEPLALAVPTGHRLAGRRSPRLSDLDSEPFVAYSEAGRYLRDLIDGECAAAGASPHIVQRMSRTHSILALVSTGLGVAIVPAGSRAAAFDNILFKPLAIAARAEWHAAWSRKPSGALVPAVLDLLRGLDR